MHAVRVSPPPIDSPRPSAPELQLPVAAPSSTTQEELKAVGRNLNIVAWLSSGFGALVSILGVCAVVLGAAIWTIDRAEASGRTAGKEEAAQVRKELDTHLQDTRRRNDWLDKTLYRQDQKTDAILMGLRLPNPAPSEPPPQRDGGQ